MDVSFWKSRKVFLTGHTGFKGSWLALWLLSMGADLCGYALDPPTEPSLYRLLKLDVQLKSIHGDIRDLNALESALRDFQPEVVIHLAAQPLVRLSYQSPVETYEVNVLGTVHLLDAIRRTPSVGAVVVVTSDKCYENQEWHRSYREHEPMGGHDPYSSSKGCAELVTAAYRRSFFHSGHLTKQVAVATARAGNVVGGGDWALDRLVPDIVRAFAAGEYAVIRNPGAVRPWQHVLEPLAGYLTLAERLYSDGHAFAEGWNFGPADLDARPVKYLVSELARLWGDAASWQIAETQNVHEDVHEAHMLRLDSAKAHARLGWSPHWGIDETLANTVDWYKRYYSGEDIGGCTLRQIGSFMEKTRVQTAPDVSA
jgi:CDP-glucose 4,6-dehydratase